MNGATFCHCGKCKIKCNKHNKLGKCDDCGKKRMLGTRMDSRNIERPITHICDECTEKYLTKEQVIEPIKGEDYAV